MITCKLLLSVIMILLLVVPVMGLPVTGAAIAIGSNNVTIPLTGCTGEALVLWGQRSGGYIWNTPNQTPVAGNADILIWGAPLFGNTLYYAKGCDSTGCGNEITFSTASITPLPTTTFGAGYQNLTRSHFNILFIGPVIESVYSPIDSPYGIPRLMLYGILISLVFIGLWLRTRSIRLCATMGLMLGVLMFDPTVGLMLGVPGAIQLLGGALLIAGIAGWLVALWLKK